MLNLHYITPNTEKITFHTNYRNLTEKVHDVIEFIRKHAVELLVISDVAFTSNKAELLEIQKVVQDQMGIKILYFDHHVYEPEFFNDITFKYVHDINDSATMIMNKAFNVKNEHLNKLSEMINIYDVWIERSKLFPIAMELNDWFFKELKTKDFDQVAYMIEQNNYRLPKSFTNFVKNNQAECKTKIQSLKNRGLFVSDGFISMIFTDDFINQALYQTFNIDKNKVALIVNSYGIIRIRFSTIDCLSDKEKEKIKMAIMGKLDIGHLNAFSIKVQNSNFEKIMNKVQELIQIINENK
jgi:oligoribonuclease NrnB/cAMP/cGMP phosphodiesterase (DHH superfamily)